jgi:hypothetical protein
VVVAVEVEVVDIITIVVRRSGFINFTHPMNLTQHPEFAKSLAHVSLELY